MESISLSAEDINDKLIHKFGKTAPLWIEDLFVFLHHQIVVDGKNVKGKPVSLSEVEEYGKYLDLLSDVLGVQIAFFKLVSNGETMQLLIDGIESYFWYVDFKYK
jgi:radical SAM superfamily enzyme with C-terminal helix-hairpin-helix motif